MNNILSVENLDKSFNGLTVLKDISFALPQGKITTLFGDNGSGKTTLFHIIFGFLLPDKGNVVYKGQKLNGKTPVEISLMGVGRVWQSPRVCQNLSLLDNLMIASRDHPGEKWSNYFIRPQLIFREEKRIKEQALQVAKEIGLVGKLGKTAGSLSFGQQKLLSIGMLLMNNAELLILDEPFAGVNAQMVDHVSEVLVALREKGKTIFFIEHNITKAMSISDLTLTLTKGSITQKKVILS